MMRKGRWDSKDRVSIVTGAAQGLGRAIAMELARRGSHVVVCDVNLEGVKGVAEEVNALGRKALALKVDVSRPSDVSEMVDRARRISEGSISWSTTRASARSLRSRR